MLGVSQAHTNIDDALGLHVVCEGNTSGRPGAREVQIMFGVAYESESGTCRRHAWARAAKGRSSQAMRCGDCERVGCSDDVRMCKNGTCR